MRASEHVCVCLPVSLPLCVPIYLSVAVIYALGGRHDHTCTYSVAANDNVMARCSEDKNQIVPYCHCASYAAAPTLHFASLLLFSIFQAIPRPPLVLITWPWRQSGMNRSGRGMPSAGQSLACSSPRGMDAEKSPTPYYMAANRASSSIIIRRIIHSFVSRKTVALNCVVPRALPHDTHTVDVADTRTVQSAVLFAYVAVIRYTIRTKLREMMRLLYTEQFAGFGVYGRTERTIGRPIRELV